MTSPSVLQRVCSALSFLSVPAALLSLLSVFSAEHLLFELLSHFRLQYIVLLILAVTLALRVRRPLVLPVLLLALVVHVQAVVRSVWPVSEPLAASVPLKVMSSNVLCSNRDIDAQIAEIEFASPDILALIEYCTFWQHGFSERLADWPFRVEANIDTPFGIALYSRLPLEDIAVLNFVDDAYPSIRATVDVQGHKVVLVATHPPPPLGQNWYGLRNRQLQSIAALSAASEAPVIVMGDLNVTPWSADFRQLEQDGGLVDARRGNALLPTWPAQLWPLQIPIDHILTSPSIRAVGMQRGGGAGSDHRSVSAVLQLALPNR